MAPCLGRLFNSPTSPLGAGLFDISETLEALFYEFGFVGGIFCGGCGNIGLVRCFESHGWKARENFFERSAIHIRGDRQSQQVQNRWSNIDQIRTKIVSRTYHPVSPDQQYTIVSMIAFVRDFWRSVGNRHRKTVTTLRYEHNVGQHYTALGAWIDIGSSCDPHKQLLARVRVADVLELRDQVGDNTFVFAAGLNYSLRPSSHKVNEQVGSLAAFDRRDFCSRPVNERFLLRDFLVGLFAPRLIFQRFAAVENPMLYFRS